MLKQLEANRSQPRLTDDNDGEEIWLDRMLNKGNSNTFNEEIKTLF